MKSSSALCFSARLGPCPWPRDPQVCHLGCVDRNIAAADFDCLGRDPLVGAVSCRWSQEGSEEGVTALDVLAEEFLTGEGQRQKAHGWISGFGSAEREEAFGQVAGLPYSGEAHPTNHLSVGSAGCLPSGASLQSTFHSILILCIYRNPGGLCQRGPFLPRLGPFQQPQRQRLS